MKAFILAAGRGARLHPVTKETPKCLVQLAGKPFLSWQIESIRAAGINQFVIAVGALAGQVKAFVSENFPEINAQFVENKEYMRTNYIYTMHLCEKYLHDDILFVHGDTVWEESILLKLLKCKHSDCVLLQLKQPAPKKDFKGRVENGLVKKISVSVQGKNCYFVPPLFKFSRKTMDLWLAEITKLVSKGKTGFRAETALNRVSEKVAIYPIYYKDEFCVEIDDHKDLQAAEKQIAAKKI